MVHDLNELQRLLLERAATPTAGILDGRVLQSTPESGHRAGYNGGKRRKASTAHVAVDTLGHLLSVVITPANEQERTQVGELCRQVQQRTGQTVQVAFGDEGYTGEEAEYAAAVHAIDLQVVKKTSRADRLCAVTPALGRGAPVCLAESFPPAGARL